MSKFTTVLHNPVTAEPRGSNREWLKSVRAEIERKEYEAAARMERRKILNETRKLNSPKGVKVRRMRCNWVRRALKLKNRLAGLPPPTNEEIRAEKKRQPNYGKPMFTISKEHMERQLASLTNEARDYYEDALAEMDCFGDPCQSQHEKALEKAVKWQAKRKSAILELEYGKEWVTIQKP